MAARQAIWRWAWRMLRKEWRGQLAIIVMIVASVTLSVGGGLAAYNLSEPNEAITSAAQLTLDGEQDNIDNFLAQLGSYGVVERATVRLAGASQSVQLRALDLTNPLIAPLVDQRAGRRPTGPREAAMTAALSSQLSAPVGATLRLDGFDLDIVGIVENPTDLDDQFLLVDDLLPPPASFETMYLTKASTDTIDSIEFQGGVGVSETIPPRVIATLFANLATVLTLMLVGLLASASFGVVARKRMRQFGLLSAIGAQTKQLRGSAAFNGFALGLISAIAGAIVGTGALALIVPRLEGSIGHRIDFAIPPLIVLPPILVATLICTLAAWIPAWSLARQSVVETLAARRPQSRPTRSFAGVGCVMVIAGYVLLDRSADAQLAVGAVGSVALLVVGVLLVTPATIALVGRVVASASLPLRIAGRDLARFQTRSAASLGAIVLALAVPVGIGVTTASHDAGEFDQPPNLDQHTAIVWGSTIERGDSRISVPVNSSVGEIEAAAIRAESVDRSLSITPIRVPIDSTMPAFPNDEGVPARGSFAVLSPLDCSRPINGDTSSYGDRNGDEICFQAHATWLATPELAELWHFDRSELTRPHSMASRGSGEYLLHPADALGAGAPTTVATTTAGVIPRNGSLPEALVTLEALGEGFEALTVGWIVRSTDPLDPALVADLRNVMGDNATLETFTEPAGSAGLRTVAALIGLAVGLVILGSTVILIRGEMSDGNRVLTVLGATAHVRRAVAGYTAGLLAFLGAVLAIPLGYVGLIIGRASGSELPHAIPWSTLFIVLVLFPLVAAGASSLLSHNQPVQLGRTLVQ